jgi:hypothetical protein
MRAQPTFQQTGDDGGSATPAENGELLGVPLGEADSSCSQSERKFPTGVLYDLDHSPARRGLMNTTLGDDEAYVFALAVIAVGSSAIGMRRWSKLSE